VVWGKKARDEVLSSPVSRGAFGRVWEGYKGENRQGGGEGLFGIQKKEGKKKKKTAVELGGIFTRGEKDIKGKRGK